MESTDVDRTAVKAKGVNPIARGILIAAGSVCVGLGIIGIVVPGMPSTVFFLIAAACYVRSSERLYNKLLNNQAVGRHIRNFREKRAMPMRAKVLALAMGWTAILLSTALAIQATPLRVFMILLGIIMTAVILSVKTLKPEDTA
jgi:hypothetical protein